MKTEYNERLDKLFELLEKYPYSEHISKEIDRVLEKIAEENENMED